MEEELVELSEVQVQTDFNLKKADLTLEIEEKFEQVLKKSQTFEQKYTACKKRYNKLKRKLQQNEYLYKNFNDLEIEQ